MKEVGRRTEQRQGLLASQPVRPGISFLPFTRCGPQQVTSFFWGSFSSPAKSGYHIHLVLVWRLRGSLCMPGDGWMPTPIAMGYSTRATRYPPHFTAMLLSLLTHHLPDYPTLAFLFVDSATLESRTVYHPPKLRKLQARLSLVVLETAWILAPCSLGPFLLANATYGWSHMTAFPGHTPGSSTKFSALCPLRKEKRKECPGLLHRDHFQ